MQGYKAPEPCVAAQKFMLYEWFGDASLAGIIDDCFLGADSAPTRGLSDATKFREKKKALAAVG